MLAPPVSRTPRDAGCRQPCPSVIRVAAPAARATVRLSTLPHPQRSSLQRLTEIAGTVALQVCKIRERPLPWLYTSTSDSTLILVGAIACPPLFVSSSWTAPGIDSLAPLPHVPANSRGRDRTPSRPPARTPGAEGATAPETLRQTDRDELMHAGKCPSTLLGAKQGRRRSKRCAIGFPPGGRLADPKSLRPKDSGGARMPWATAAERPVVSRSSM